MAEDKIVAIAFSDLHIHKFKRFDKNNSRLSWTLKALETLLSKADALKVPILFSGDLFHNPKEIENETLSLALGAFNKCLKNNFLAISGNHDLSEKNNSDKRSPSHINSIAKTNNLFNNIDFSWHAAKNFTVWGLPYMNYDLDLKKAIEKLKPEVKENPAKFKILLLHSDCPGAVTPEGLELSETEHIPWDLDTFFKEWDLVLFGHIHKPQKLSNRCYMMGSPIHQTAGDSGTDMGYWEIYENKKIVFKRISHKYPQFVKLENGEYPPIEPGINYYIPHNAGNKEEVGKLKLGKFNIHTSKKKLAKRYCKLKGIKSKKKINALIKILENGE